MLLNRPCNSDYTALLISVLSLVSFCPRHTCGALCLLVFFKMLLLPTSLCVGWKERGWWPLCVRPLVPGESPAVSSSADEVDGGGVLLVDHLGTASHSLLQNHLSQPCVGTSAQSLVAGGTGSILSLPSELVPGSVSLLPERLPTHTHCTPHPCSPASWPAPADALSPSRCVSCTTSSCSVPPHTHVPASCFNPHCCQDPVDHVPSPRLGSTTQPSLC